jgi:hypothetical protein
MLKKRNPTPRLAARRLHGKSRARDAIACIKSELPYSWEKGRLSLPKRRS